MKRAFLPFFLLAVLFPPSLLRADQFSLIPSVAEKLEYTDNLLITPTNKLSDFISTTSGGLQLLDKSELMSLDVSARLDQREYRDNPTFDATDEYFQGTLGFTLSPKLSVSLNGSYTRSSLPEEFFLTSGIVLNTTTKEVTSEGMAAQYALTDQTQSTFSYQHGTYWYRAPGYVDMVYDSANLLFEHDLSTYVQNLKGRFTLGYIRYDFTGLTTNNYEATTGFEYRLHENWTFLVDGGARYTVSYFQAQEIVAILGPFVFVSTENVTSTGVAPIGTVKLTYKGELSNVEFSFMRDVMPAYGALGTFERTMFIADVDRQFTYDLSGRFQARYFINQSQPAQYTTSHYDSDAFYASPSIRYKFTKDMYIEGSYYFIRVENNVVHTTAVRNDFFLRFYLQHPILE